MKNIKSIFTVFILVMLVITSCNKDENTSIVPEKVKFNEQTKNEVFNFIQTNLSDEYKLLTLYNKSDEAILIESMKKRYSNKSLASKDYDAIVNRRESLKTDKIEFSSFSVKLKEKESSFSIDNDVIVVKAAVAYRLPTKSKDTETGRQIVTEGIDYYKFKIIKVNGSYLISEKSKVFDFPISDVLNEDEIIIFRNHDNNDNNNIKGTYSVTAAVNFAITKYNNPPTTGYYDYSSAGGDCTNFLSHCLKAGGWSQVNTWHWNSNGTSCDYNMTTCTRSPSWTSASKFYEYITNSGASRVISRFTDVQVYYWYSLPSTRSAFRAATCVVNNGDIIQLSTTTTKSTVHHSTIVTSKDAAAQQVFVTYRNADGYPVAKDRYIGDFSGGQYVHGFAVKTSY